MTGGGKEREDADCDQTEENIVCVAPKVTKISRPASQMIDHADHADNASDRQNRRRNDKEMSDLGQPSPKIAMENVNF